jgi:hypothetical protein
MPRAQRIHQDERVSARGAIGFEALPDEEAQSGQRLVLDRRSHRSVDAR